MLRTALAVVKFKRLRAHPQRNDEGNFVLHVNAGLGVFLLVLAECMRAGAEQACMWGCRERWSGALCRSC